jgi:ATP-dependent Clp protease ATP-binding subunit ClpC
VVLLDEIEKAHSDVFNMLLQIMEEGRLTDSFGRHVDFKNVILIMTSNIGAEVIRNQAVLGFRKVSEETTYENMKKMLMEEVERHFRPEFLNRLDDVIVFKALTRDDLREIVKIEMRGVQERLKQRGVKLKLEEEAVEFLINKGYNPEFGARPLRRAIEQYVEDPLSEDILRGDFEGINLVVVRAGEERLVFEPRVVEGRQDQKEEEALQGVER